MYDFFISYGHEEADAAQRVAENLRALGRSVWIDSPASVQRESGMLGIPAGQPHWQVIREAIAASGTLLVIDGPDLRASAYCVRELTHARSLGTRAAAITNDPGDPRWEGMLTAAAGAEAALVRSLAPGDAAAAARVRLGEAAEAAETGAKAALVDRALGHRGLTEAARTLLGGSQEAAHAIPPPWLVEFAHGVLSAGQKRRSRWRRSAVALVSVLAVLAGASVVSFIGAGQDRDVAQRDAADARSLDLAGQAFAVGSAVEGRRLAVAAREAADTPLARSALMVANARLRTVGVHHLPVHLYREAFVSPQGTRFAARYDSGVLVASTGGDLIVDLDIPDVRALLFLDEATLLVVSRNTSVERAGVELVHLDDHGRRERREWVQARVRALRLGTDGTVWWAASNGPVGRYDVVADAWTTDVALPGTLGDLLVTDGAVLRSRADGIVARYAIPLTEGPPLWEVDLTTVQAMAPEPATGVDVPRDRQGALRSDRTSAPSTGTDMVMCGDRLHVAAHAAGLRHVALLALDPADGRPKGTFSFDFGAHTAACLPDGGLWLGGVLGDRPSTVPSTLWSPAVMEAEDGPTARLLLQSPQHDWLAVLTSTGELAVVGEDPDLTRTAGQAMRPYLFSGDRVVVQMLDGSFELFDLGQTREVVGRADEPWTNAIALGSDRFLVATGTAFALLTPEGLGRRWAMPDAAVSAHPIGEGEGFVVGTLTGAVRFWLDRDNGESLPSPKLNPYEQVSDVVLHEGMMFVSTNRARLLVLDPVSGEQARETSLGVAGRLELAPASGGVVVLSQDGVLHRFDGALAPQGSLWFGTSGQRTSERSLTYAPGTPVYLVRTATRGIVVDAASLTISQRLPLVSADGTIVLGADGSAALTFERYSRSGGDEAGTEQAWSLWPTYAREGLVPDLPEGARDTEALVVLSHLCGDCG